MTLAKLSLSIYLVYATFYIYMHDFPNLHAYTQFFSSITHRYQKIMKWSEDDTAPLEFEI